MNSFETKIVKTWEPSNWLRGIIVVLLLASAIVVFVWKPEISWLVNICYVVYFITLFFGLGQSFLKPKFLGNLSISEEKIQVDLHGEKKNFAISELKELGFDYMGYASFWRHICGNKNHLFFMLSSGEKFDYEIVLQNKEMKEEFKSFLKRIQETTYLKIEKTGNYTF